MICGDSRDFIRRIPDASINLILTDPPYNLARHSTGNIPLPGRSTMNNDVADWDMVDFHPEEWADEFVRILKPTGNLFIFTSYNQIGKWYDCLDHRFDASNFMVWHKTNPAPKIFKAGFLNSCELIFTCWNKRHTWHFSSQKEMHNFLETPICMRPERLQSPKHPTQKPVAILRRIIEMASDAGGIVFDPFMGVGSVGVAALGLGRRYIGIEIDKEYHAAAKQRIEQTQEPSTHDEMASEPLADYGAARAFDISIFDERPALRVAKPLSCSLAPVIKWAGGKEKELKHIIPALPESFQNYYEPFVGGGSVFMSVNAQRYFINDLSQELITLYRNIATADNDFFDIVADMDAAWVNAQRFAESHTEMAEMYKKYRADLASDDDVKTFVKSFCEENVSRITSLLPATLAVTPDKLISEIRRNVTAKLLRMRKVELEKHTMPDTDIAENILTAIKGSVYMYLRALYNDKALLDSDKALASALFFFIRNYAYSGMFRYNRNGEFNVPYGGMGYNGKTLKKKADYYKSEAVRRHFAKAEIYNLDFEAFLDKAKPTAADFVFLDPPYDSEFSTYAGNAFTHADQQRLADLLINRCRAKWMMIIKHTDFIYGLYADRGLNIRTFDKEYLVSFMNRNDRRATHLLITNY